MEISQSFVAFSEYMNFNSMPPFSIPLLYKYFLAYSIVNFANCIAVRRISLAGAVEFLWIILCEAWVGLKPEIIALGQPKIANLKKKIVLQKCKISFKLHNNEQNEVVIGIDIDFFFYFDVFDKVAIMKSLSCSPDPTPIPKLQILNFS